jgi:DNA-binding transcriptional MerR regulator
LTSSAEIGFSAGRKMKNEDDWKDGLSIDEVADRFGVNVWTVRLWINRFTVLKPRRNVKGNLFFTSEDVEKIEAICRLTKVKGMKLEEARKHLHKP